MGKLENEAFRGGMSKKNFKSWRIKIIRNEMVYIEAKENVDWYKKAIRRGGIPPEIGKDSVKSTLRRELMTMNYDELKKIERKQKNRY